MQYNKFKFEFHPVFSIQTTFMQLGGPCAEVEKNPFCRSILQARQAEGHLPQCPIYDDIITLDPSQHDCADVSGLTGGFPCQVPSPVVRFEYIHID